jgi:hypothetical protein
MDENYVPKFEDTDPHPDYKPKFEDTDPTFADSDIGQDVDKDITFKELSKLFGQGVTYNNMDELTAALMATKSMLTGDISSKDWYDKYRKEQVAEQEAIKKIEKEHPKTAFATELAGGIISPINKVLMPAKALGVAGQVATKLPASEVIKQGAIMGAKGGALAGIGGSEKNIEQPIEYAKDIAGYGVAGGAVGGGLSTIGTGFTHGLPALKEKLASSSPLGKNIVTAFEKSKEGKGFISSESEARLAKEMEESGQKFGEAIYGEEGPIAKTSKELTDFFQAADDTGTKVAPDEQVIDKLVGAIEDLEANKLVEFKDVKKQFRDPDSISARIYKVLGRQGDAMSSMSSNEVKIFLEYADKYITGQLSPSEAYNFGRWLEKADIKGLGTLKGSKFVDIVNKLPELSKGIKDNAVLNAEEILGKSSREIFDRFKDVRSSTVETILNKATPEQLADIWQSDFSKQEIRTKLYKDFQELFKHIGDPSTAGDEGRNTIRVLEQRVNDLNKKHPDLKLNIKDLLDEVKDVASQRAIRNKLVTTHTGAGGSTSDLISKLGDYTGYGGAIVAGKAVNKVASFNNALVKASDATLMPLAQKLKQTPGIGHIGQALEDALNNPKGNAKNAAIFMILQNPEASAAAKGMIGMED